MALLSLHEIQVSGYLVNGRHFVNTEGPRLIHILGLGKNGVT